MQILAVFAFRSNVHLTFLVFFLHDIARTAEIHTKTTYGHYMGTTWALHGHYMGTTWALHGHYTGTTWALHGHYMGTTWALHGHYTILPELLKYIQKQHN